MVFLFLITAGTLKGLQVVIRKNKVHEEHELVHVRTHGRGFLCQISRAFSVW